MRNAEGSKQEEKMASVQIYNFQPFRRRKENCLDPRRRLGEQRRCYNHNVSESSGY